MKSQLKLFRVNISEAPPGEKHKPLGKGLQLILLGTDALSAIKTVLKEVPDCPVIEKERLWAQEVTGPFRHGFIIAVLDYADPNIPGPYTQVVGIDEARELAKKMIP